MQFNGLKKYYTALIFVCCLNLNAQTYFPPKTGTWDTLSTNRFGYCQNKIDSLYNFLSQNNSKSFILLKDGKIVLEKYFGTFTKDSNWYWSSAGKTLTGFCVGIANQEGLLKLTDKSSKYLGAGWTTLSSKQEDSICIINQITMTTGLKDNVNDADCTLPTCLQYAATSGSRWAYHNAPYTLLDKVIESASGVALNAYVLSKVSSVVGMKGIYFKSGYNNVYASDSRSMARFGLLLLNKGNWNGTAIMKDSNFFKQMINSSQSINKGYGYLTWLNGKASYMVPQTQFVFTGSISPDAPNDVFMALGKNGQLINVCPSKGLVWIRMGNAPSNNGLVPWIFNNEIWKYINQLPCAKTSDLELSNEKLGLFPNVAKSGEMVLLQTKSKDVPQIFNSLWQSIKVQGEVTTEGYRINTENMPSGMYLIKLKNGKSVRMVIQ
jgi:hypothetical protein